MFYFLKNGIYGILNSKEANDTNSMLQIELWVHFWEKFSILSCQGKMFQQEPHFLALLSAQCFLSLITSYLSCRAQFKSSFLSSLTCKLISALAFLPSFFLSYQDSSIVYVVCVCLSVQIIMKPWNLISLFTTACPALGREPSTE